MNRKVVLLNLALLAMAGSLIWLLRAQWLDSQARQRAVLAQRIPPKNVFAPPPPAPVKPIAPSEYIDVAQKMLFSKDRNPTVVIDTPAPKPEPPMPALPQYHGQMAFGAEPIVLLSMAGGSQSGVQKGYHAGDEVGDFKLISFDRDTIALEWHGKKVERKVEELKPKEVPGQAVAAASPPASAVPAAPPRPITSLGTSLGTGADTAANPAQKVDPTLGDDIGSGMRACVPGDNSPAGTILSGYKKTITPFMFGQVCRWEQNK